MTSTIHTATGDKVYFIFMKEIKTPRRVRLKVMLLFQKLPQLTRTVESTGLSWIPRERVRELWLAVVHMVMVMVKVTLLLLLLIYSLFP